MATDGWTYTGPGAGYNPTYGSVDRSGNTMYALGSASTAQPPAFDWRLGLWQVANRWNPTWAAANPYTNITDAKQVADALSMATLNLSRTDPRYAAYNADIAYINAGNTNTGMPTWYNIKQPWNETPTTPTPTPTTGYTPAPGIPTFDWSQFGGNTATNPAQQFAGTPGWMNDPNWYSNGEKAQQAEKWASVMVPWTQLMQNSYQYMQDSNEAQRRYNLERAWTQAQDQFNMQLSADAAAYQKERDKQEFELGRQQVWGRNVAPNTKWMRSWG